MLRMTKKNTSLFKSVFSYFHECSLSLEHFLSAGDSFISGSVSVISTQEYCMWVSLLLLTEVEALLSGQKIRSKY